MLLIAVAISACFSQSVAKPRAGIPFTRAYSLDDVGVTRNLKLGFDPIGRLAAIDRDNYVVLNDSTWINQIDEDQRPLNMLATAASDSGNIYFGAIASWGILERQSNGKLKQKSFRPENVPAWVDATNFTFILPHYEGIYFAGINGLVFWNRSTGEQVFLEVHDLIRPFTLNGIVYISSHHQGICRVDLENKRVVPISDDASTIPFCAAAIDKGKAVIATTKHQLALFDGNEVRDWQNDLGISQSAQISNIISLPGGNIAIAIDGRGLFILTPNGECIESITTPDYQRITFLACREEGVLWVATEIEIHKILYGDPITILDQRSGISVSWPMIIEWKGNPVIVSHGILYEQVTNADGMSQQFQAVPNSPVSGVLAAVSIDDQLLVANRDGVHLKTDSGFENILPNMDVSRLMKIDGKHCLVIGRSEITSIEWDGQRWIEPRPRIKGVGFPFVAIAAKKSVWIELGANRAARIAIQDNQIRATVFDTFPWEGLSWIHIGVIDQFVVLTGLEGDFVIYDDDAEKFTESSKLTELIANAPSPIYRPIKDSQGLIWAAHEHGIYAIEHHGKEVSFDSDSYRNIRLQIPFIQTTGPKDIWVTNGTALYHVAPKDHQYPRPKDTPLLVSITDMKTDRILYSVFNTIPQIEELPFSQNDLEFHFFSGSYTAPKSPIYEFHMSSNSSDWTIRSPESSISLTSLKEGDYRLSAQLVENKRFKGKPALASFSIHPPWFRTSLAYLAYWTFSILAIIGAIVSFTTRSKRRHAYLEALVNERTNELRNTLEKLNQKEKKAATLAERNRLASEIHDSVQQGLSGLALQIEATLKLPELVSSIRSRLDVAKNMVSFTRHELQQAIWGLESPLLENSDLASALEKMVELISTGEPKLEFHSTGQLSELNASTQHHLLRIAQEAVTNSVKHAEADRISIQLKSRKTDVTLEIIDDGCGFKASDILANGIGHFGLRGMRARVSKINGTLEIDSTPGRGTKVRVSTPISNSFESKNDDN